MVTFTIFMRFRKIKPVHKQTHSIDKTGPVGRLFGHIGKSGFFKIKNVRNPIWKQSILKNPFKENPI